MNKVKLKLEKGLVILVISEQLSKKLVADELLVEGMNGHRFVDPINIEIEVDKPMTKAEKVVNVEDWIEEWRELFPKGLNSNGYPYRGDKSACLAKMQTFIRNNGYSKEEIMNATKIIINRFKLKDYEFMPLAHYMIEKNRVSSLKQYCDMVKDGVMKPVKEGSSYEEKL